MKRLPKKGTEVIGWKKVFHRPTGNCAIVQLIIPADAERVCPTYGYGKCRASAARVEAVLPYDDSCWPEMPFLEALGPQDAAESLHEPAFEYVVGSLVIPDSYNPDPTVDCSHGIHFFLTMVEALEY